MSTKYEQLEVLSSYDGCEIYTCKMNDELCYGHFYDWEQSEQLDMIVPMGYDEVERLKRGEIDIRTLFLDRPIRLYGRFNNSIRSVSFEEVEDAIPEPGVKLYLETR